MISVESFWIYTEMGIESREGHQPYPMWDKMETLNVVDPEH